MRGVGKDVCFVPIFPSELREFCQAIIPTLNQQVDIGFRGDRRGEHHIVEGCDQRPRLVKNRWV